MYFGYFDFRDDLGFLNCDNICMYVVHMQPELPELFFVSVYVDLQYDEIYITITAGSVAVRCQQSCGSLRSSCEVAVVPHVVGEVVAVTVMQVPLPVLHACLLRDC